MMSPVRKIGIIDYGAGNLRSLVNALARLQREAQVCTAPSDIKACQALILPGVGSFPAAMKTMGTRRLLPPLREAWHKGVPILGICLGMQLFYEGSEECGGAAGLGWLAGRVRRLTEAPKLPHVGWNTLSTRRGLYRGVEQDESYVYFTHSYILEYKGQPECTSSCTYGTEFVAGLRNDKLLGYQFHPEKSGDTGSALLADFVRKAEEKR